MILTHALIVILPRIQSISIKIPIQSSWESGRNYYKLQIHIQILPIKQGSQVHYYTI
jgi:hypothetical protein